ncbi:MAG: DEAD/DEAH box helicase [Actinomycetales bacterium]
MGATIHDVLDELRAAASSEADKGRKLELLIQAFLRTDPVYAEQFSDVWLWRQWPGRDGKPDTGIDLVAADRLTGGTVAIQCKFFAPGTTIAKPDIDSFLAASGKHGFTERLIVSTTDRWNANAESAIAGQQIPVRRLGVSDLAASPVDWSQFSLEHPQQLTTRPGKQLRPHQSTALADVLRGFETHDRGKLIMACGTGKTFTSLRLAERQVGAGGTVLFLVPSISLLSQSLREWATEAVLPLAPLAVCSDRKATRTGEDISAVDLALPATTDVDVLARRLAFAAADTAAMTVVFSTYQSLDVVARARQAAGIDGFDLTLCDEAHRTTGATLAGEDESSFVRVHDDTYLPTAKRLYMTATPRIYDDSSKAKAGEANAVLASMDDETVYGPELHRLGFGEAVARDLLTDYKVLVLAVDETAVARTFQVQLAEDGELKLDDAAKIIGCWNGLAKRGDLEHPFDTDPQPMRRAVAFAGTIADSRTVQALFTSTVRTYNEALTGQTEPPLACEIQHVDGTFNALERNARLDWLRAEVPDGTCRILTNARCLSEGVDVPALDAVMFLAPRKSVVDIVQSVGRVMRKAPGKQYGYIILPVGVPAGTSPEQALRDNKRYAAVWEVLQALRAHDERFNAMVNRIELTSARDDRINVIGVPTPGDGDGHGAGDGRYGQPMLPLTLAQLDEWREAIYARIVAKVGSRKYWEQWAADVADIAARHMTRITALLGGGNPTVTAEFDRFLDGLRGNLNDGITGTEAVEMLAQHLITRPVFDALFGGYDFAATNPVAQTMERMLAALDEHALDDENSSLEKFYDSVRMRVAGVDTAEGRQRLIVQLYDTFFATAFKKTVDRLGIVYTPVEIVDFILRSADEVLREHFGQGLTDEGVHVLDGFAGTGTFIVRLLQLGLIQPQDLARKYANELHANEMLLLAYYIAAVNIETTYQDIVTGSLGSAADYEPFPGLVLTDTFQSYEDGDRDDLDIFPTNNARIERQRALPITVIVGNPPYSVGQDSANDNNANTAYPSIDTAIRDTYAARSTATLKNSLYDSYIRAIKWATLRIRDRGVIAFVTNGGFLDANTADGLRQTLAEEFTAIHVYNLRGNARTAGELRRQEGGSVFDAGSRATVAITVLVRDPDQVRPGGGAVLRYTDIGDYLDRDAKLAAITAAGSLAGLDAVELTPNEHGDWLTIRSDDFATYLPVADREGGPAVFKIYSGGLKTNRDAWNYNMSRQVLESNTRATLAFYNTQVERVAAGNDPDRDPTRISWDRVPLADVARGVRYTYRPEAVVRSMYRPFTKQWVYSDRRWNNTVYQLPRMFPTPEHDNIGFYLVGTGSAVPFSGVALDVLPDLHVTGAGSNGQFYSRWTWQRVGDDGTLDFDEPGGDVVDGYSRVDNITDAALDRFTAAYPAAGLTKDDVFYYCYGLLHSTDYRSRYAADLKRALPRIPLVADPAPYIAAGRELAALHVGYETVEAYPLGGLDAAPAPGGDRYAYYRVERMRFGKPTPEQKAAGLKTDRSTVVVNDRITVTGVPEQAHRYMLGSRSAVEWILERYQVKPDKASGIVNDPNDWAREVGDPRYILDLLARIVTVSIRTMEIVDALPDLDILANQNPSIAESAELIA